MSSEPKVRNPHKQYEGTVVATRTSTCTEQHEGEWHTAGDGTEAKPRCRLLPFAAPPSFVRAELHGT